MSLKTLIQALLLLAIAVFPLVTVAQTVTVDNTDASPNNTSTFDSVMMALHSFQQSGAVTAASPGGVGVNHGNAAADVINIVATGVIYDEIIRIDDRPNAGTSGDHQCILDEKITINGVASGGNDKPILAPKDYDDVDDDCFEIRTDVDFEISDIIFMYNPANPAAGGDPRNYNLVTIDRLNTTSGSPSEFSFNDCVFTSADTSGNPTVTNADEAFIDRRAEISDSTTGGNGGRMVAYFPDPDEGMKGSFNRCVFSHNTAAEGSRYAFLYFYFGGISSTWTEEVGGTVNSCIFTYGTGPGIEMQAGGNSVNAALQYLNITGTDAATGGLATGAPTVIAYEQNSALPNNACGIFPLATNGADNAMSGNWDNLWIVGCDGAAIYCDTLDAGSKFFWNLSDALLVGNNQTADNTFTIRSQWADPAATHSNTMNWSNVTIIGGNPSSSETGAAVLFGDAAAATGSPTINMSNVIIGQSATAAYDVIGIQNDGGTAVNVSDSALVTAGPNALGAGTHANTGSGSVNLLSGITNSDPGFYNTTTITDPNFYALTSDAYREAGPAGADLDGGRFIAVPPLSAKMWNVYE